MREKIEKAECITRLALKSGLPNVRSMFLILDKYEMHGGNFFSLDKNLTFHVIVEEQMTKQKQPVNSYYVKRLINDKWISQMAIIEIDIIKKGEENFKEFQDLLLQQDSQEKGIIIPNNNKTILTP